MMYLKQSFNHECYYNYYPRLNCWSMWWIKGDDYKLSIKNYYNMWPTLTKKPVTYVLFNIDTYYTWYNVL